VNHPGVRANPIVARTTDSSGSFDGPLAVRRRTEIVFPTRRRPAESETPWQATVEGKMAPRRGDENGERHMTTT